MARVPLAPGFQTPPQLKAVAHQVHKIGSGSLSHVFHCWRLWKFGVFGSVTRILGEIARTESENSSHKSWFPVHTRDDGIRTKKELELHTSSLKRTALLKSCVRGLLPTQNSLKHVARRVPLVTRIKAETVQVHVSHLTPMSPIDSLHNPCPLDSLDSKASDLGQIQSLFGILVGDWATSKHGKRCFAS